MCQPSGWAYFGGALPFTFVATPLANVPVLRTLHGLQKAAYAWSPRKSIAVADAPLPRSNTGPGPVAPVPQLLTNVSQPASVSTGSEQSTRYGVSPGWICSTCSPAIIAWSAVG